MHCAGGDVLLVQVTSKQVCQRDDQSRTVVAVHQFPVARTAARSFKEGAEVQRAVWPVVVWVAWVIDGVSQAERVGRQAARIEQLTQAGGQSVHVFAA